MPITTITIPHFATGPTPPRAASADGPNMLRTRVADLVAKMGPPPWSRRVIQDERNLVTLIANRPGGGNRPHWHADFDEWWVVMAGEFTWELTGGIVVEATQGRHRLGAARHRASHQDGGHRELAASRGGHAAGHALLQLVRAVRVRRRRPPRVERLSA